MLDTIDSGADRRFNRAGAYSARKFQQDGRVCDVSSEIQRCIAFQHYLERSDPGEFVSAMRPRPCDPLISVILPMYNASAWIETTLKSLLLQTGNIEIFCVDDASTDDTYERVLRTFGEDGRIFAARLANNVGPYQIRNWVAEKLARGDLLAFQDADDWSHPNRFEMQKESMRRNAFVACGTSAHQICPPGFQPHRNDTAAREHDGLLHSLTFYSHVPRVRSSLALPLALRARPPVYRQKVGNELVPVPANDSPALYATMMIRKEVFLAFGGFDGRVKIQADKNFAFRLARFHAIANLPAVLYSWRRHAASLTQNPETGFASELRQEQIRVYENNDHEICQSLENGNEALTRQLCTSDLYHADIEIRDVHANKGFSELLLRI